MHTFGVRVAAVGWRKFIDTSVVSSTVYSAVCGLHHRNIFIAHVHVQAAGLGDQLAVDGAASCIVCRKMDAPASGQLSRCIVQTAKLHRQRVLNGQGHDVERGNRQ